MNKAQRNTLMWRWSLISFVAIALYWILYRLITGTMPTGLTLKDKLPAIPRIWDCLLGPIFSIILFSLLGRYWNDKGEEDDDFSELDVALSAFFMVFWLISLGAGISSGIVAGIFVAVVLTMVSLIGLLIISLLRTTHNGKIISRWLAATDKK